MLASYAHVGPVDGVVCIAGLVHLPAEQLPLAFRRMAEPSPWRNDIFEKERDGT